jgi:uncharacterized protein YprB with RNaseH-like and TPR domain
MQREPDMENRLRHQLALIKARALLLARRTHARPQHRDGAGLHGPGCNGPAVARAGSGSTASAPHPIVDDLMRAGAVARASDLASGGLDSTRRLRHGPWWWKRRLGTLHPADSLARGERASSFEAEFQSLLASLAGGDALPIEQAVPGEACALAESAYYLVRSAGASVDPLAPFEAARFAAIASWPETVSRAMVGRFVRRGYDALGYNDGARDFGGLLPLFRQADPRSVLFLDIETAGLSPSTYVFLCGLMHLSTDPPAFQVEQVFARDYAEEEGLLRHVRSRLGRFDTVVTYNGASFDVPFLRTRMAVHGIPDIVPMGSVDLLQASRRVFRSVLPNVRLVTVERHLRGLERVGDIPSRFIPRAYHEYVRTGDARVMRNVVYHNRMDLFTMAVILNRLVENGEGPLREESRA